MDSLRGSEPRGSEPHGSKSDPVAAFAEAVSIMRRLRAPGGCPWDREQTLESIQRHTLEEVYEVLDAIDRRNWKDLCEELGDLLLQVLFYAQIAAEAGSFDIAEVVLELNRKLVRRHPHVFGDAASAAAGNGAAAAIPVRDIDSAQVLRNWEAIKQAEKASRGAPGGASGAESAAGSALDGIPRSMPALMEARKLGSRAAKSGFDWTNVEGVFEKLHEEEAELRQALEQKACGGEESAPAELGDLLFTAANLARHLEVDPEIALRQANARFRQRFALMENAAPAPLETLSANQLETLWSKAKEAEARTSSAAAAATTTTTAL